MVALQVQRYLGGSSESRISLPSTGGAPKVRATPHVATGVDKASSAFRRAAYTMGLQKPYSASYRSNIVHLLVQ